MSIDKFPASNMGFDKPKKRAVSDLEVGDFVLDNGSPTRITKKIRSSTGTALMLESGGYRSVDDDSEEIEVPQ